ncbi:MAG TPA: hypothetical protein VJH67_00215, partial [Candidatus Paceibacterota bacterium]
MEEPLIQNGKTFISSKRAASRTGYTTDYIGQLCRAKKVEAIRVGHSWYVVENSILEHKQNFQAISSRYLSKKRLTERKNLEAQVKAEERTQLIQPKKITEVPQYVAIVQSKPSSGIKYSSEEKELLFPAIPTKKIISPVSSVLNNFENPNSFSPKKNWDFNKNFLSVSAAFAAVLILFTSLTFFEEPIRKNLTRIEEPTIGYQAAAGIFAEGVNSVVSGTTGLWGRSTTYVANKFFSWVKGEMIARGLLDNNVSSSNKVTIESGQSQISSKTNSQNNSKSQVVIVSSSDRSYIDQKIEELRNNFISTVSSNVNRYYVTRQNDVIVDRLSGPITSLDGATITNSSFSGSASLTSLSVSGATDLSGNLTVLGSTTVADLTATDWLAVGTTTMYDTLTLDGAFYLASIGVPSDTSSRLYNTNNGDLYWAGNLVGGSAVGTWTTDGTHAWRAGGNVGIGSTTPGYKLSVAGSGYFDGGTVTSASFIATSTIATSTIAGGLAIETSGFVYDYSTNNVGIGTASPKAKLEVSGGRTRFDSGDDYALEFYRNGDASAYVGVNGTQDFTVSDSDGTQRFTVMTTSGTIGNVGIGTTNPGYKLSVAGSGYFDGGTVTAANFVATSSVNFLYSSSTIYSSFATASTTNLIINGQSFNNLLGSGLVNSSGALTVSAVPLSSLAALPINSVVTTNSSGVLIATGTQLTVGNLLATSTTNISTLPRLSNTFASSTYSSFSTASTTNLIVNAESVNNLAGTGLTITTGALNCDTASASVFGCLAAADFSKFNSATTTFSTGLTYSGATNAVTVNTSQNIATLSNLTTNGLVTTSGSNGTLSVTANGTDGFVLAMSNGVPTYVATTTLSTITGTLSVSKGGTNATSFANNSIITSSADGLSLIATGTQLTVGNLLATSTTATSTFLGGLTVGNNAAFSVNQTATANSLYVAASGNVGIGTTAPGVKLEVYSSENNSATTINNYVGGLVLANPNVTTDTYSAIKFSGVAGTDGTFIKSVLKGNDNHELHFGEYTNAPTQSTFMVIDTNGNVGIGTTGPAQLLHVYGTSGRIKLETGHANDNVQILLKNSNASPTNAFQQISFGDVASDAAGYIKYSHTESSVATDYLALATAGSEWMRINNLGNVGIGTTSPFALLSVAGDGFFNGNLTAANITATGTLAVTGQTTLGYASTTGLTVSGSTYLATTNGNVGIGTTGPGQKLHVYSSVASADFVGGWINNGDATGNSVLRLGYNTNLGTDISQQASGPTYIDNRYNDAASAIVFRTKTSGTAVEGMRIISTGNVGIGTTNPGSNLTVQATNPYIELSNGTHRWGTSVGVAGANNNFLIRDIAQSANRLQIDTSGNLGLGGTITDAAFTGASVVIKSGNVGIGTTSPASKLSIYDTGTAQQFNVLQVTNYGTGNNGDISGIGFNAGEGQIYGVKGALGFVRTDSYGRGDLAFYLNNTAGTESVSTGNEIMRITKSGNVGIGTTSPFALLSVAGDGFFNGNLTAANITATGTLAVTGQTTLG